MNIRLAWLSVVAAIGVGLVSAGPAQAQGAYPDKVIKMIVPAPPGGQTDVLARLLAQKMQQGARAERDHRQPSRRRRRARRPGIGGGRARRLHAVLRQYLDARRDPGGLQEPRLQSGEELRAGRQRVRKLHDPGGSPGFSGEDRRGVRGLRQGQSRQAQLRPRGRWQRDAPDRRDVPLAGQDRFPRRPASRRRGVDHQPARPAGGFPVREPGRAAAAHSRRQAARARRDQRHRPGRHSRPWWKPGSPASSPRC